MVAGAAPAGAARTLSSPTPAAAPTTSESYGVATRLPTAQRPCRGDDHASPLSPGQQLRRFSLDFFAARGSGSAVSGKPAGFSVASGKLMDLIPPHPIAKGGYW